MLPGVEYVIITPSWVSSHASFMSLLSFVFLMYAVINIEKRGFSDFYLPLLAGASVLIASYPVFEAFSYAIVGWVLIASLIVVYRLYLQLSGVRV